MEMRVYHLGDAVLTLGREIEIWLDIQLRVNDSSFATLARGQEVRSAPRFVVQELLEVHNSDPPFNRLPSKNGTPRCVAGCPFGDIGIAIDRHRPGHHRTAAELSGPV